MPRISLCSRPAQADDVASAEASFAELASATHGCLLRVSEIYRIPIQRSSASESCWKANPFDKIDRRVSVSSHSSLIAGWVPEGPKLESCFIYTFPHQAMQASLDVKLEMVAPALAVETSRWKKAAARREGRAERHREQPRAVRAPGEAVSASSGSEARGSRG